MIHLREPEPGHRAPPGKDSGSRAGSPSRQGLLDLQRFAGNAAVTRLLSSRARRDLTGAPTVQRVSRVRVAGKRAPTTIERLETAELVKLLDQYDKNALVDFVLEPDVFLGETVGDMIAEARRVLKAREAEARPRDMKFRAEELDKGDVFICTTDPVIQDLAVNVLGIAPIDGDMARLLLGMGGYHLVFSEGGTMVGMVGGLERIPRADRDMTIPKTPPPLPSTCPARPYLALTQGGYTTAVMRVTLAKPPVKAGGGARKTAMSGYTALAYAIGSGAVDPSGPREMEWLHLWGDSLGGPTEQGNLVAATVDANTYMIPFERTVLTRAKQINPADASTFLTYEVTCMLYGNTWVAQLIAARLLDATGQEITRIPPVTCLQAMPMARQAYEVMSAILKAANS